MGKGKARPRRKAHVRAWYGGTSELASPLVSLGSTKGACARTGLLLQPKHRQHECVDERDANHPRVDTSLEDAISADLRHGAGAREGLGLGGSGTLTRGRGELQEARAPEQHAHARVARKVPVDALSLYRTHRRGVERRHESERGRGGSDHCGTEHEPTGGCALELCNGPPSRWAA